MIIYTTKKLAPKLPSVSTTALTETIPLGSWHANLYLINRRNCIMFCHNQTRFVLFMAGLKKSNFANLDFWFQDLYANTMLKLDYDTALIEKALSLVDKLQFDTACDRSVQGTMRIAHQDLDAMLMGVADIMELPPYSVSARLNHRPVTTKGMKGNACLWPDEAMKEWIASIDR
jgi:Domain of unknown function (DUF6933)